MKKRSPRRKASPAPAASERRGPDKTRKARRPASTGGPRGRPGTAEGPAGAAPVAAAVLEAAGAVELTPLQTIQRKLYAVERSLAYLNSRPDSDTYDPISEEGPLAEHRELFEVLLRRLDLQFAAVQANADAVVRPTAEQIARVLEAVERLEGLNRDQAIATSVVDLLRAAFAAAAPLASNPGVSAARSALSGGAPLAGASMAPFPTAEAEAVALAVPGIAAAEELTPSQVVVRKIHVVGKALDYLEQRRGADDFDPIAENDAIEEQIGNFERQLQRLNLQLAAVQANADAVVRPTAEQIAQVLDTVQRIEALNRNQAIGTAVLSLLNTALTAAAPLAPKPSPGLSAAVGPAEVAGRRFLGQSALPGVANFVMGSLRASALKITPTLDHRLQVALARSRMGVPRAATSSAGSDEIAIIARVTDVSAWEAISEVRVGAILGPTDEGHQVVTGRIPVQRIEAVRGNGCVFSLKASQSVRPALAFTTREMGVTPQSIPAGADPQGGAGVVVGIVDFGCDFAHRNFRNPDGTTRLLALWNQAGIATADSPFGYGRLHRPEEINDALVRMDPYEALGYGPALDGPSQQGTHGTHVMDIAAGNGMGSGVPGCAPAADLVFVEASTHLLPWFGQDAVGKSFGDSVQLLEAVRFVFDLAGDRPCVVNLSLGTNGGPHDGTTLVEQGLDALVRARPNRMIVIAAANSQADGVHARGTVPPGGSLELAWNTPASDDGHELEIWLPGGAEVAMELVAPDGTAFGPVEPGSNLPIGSGQQLVVYLSNRLNEPNNHDNALGVFLAGGLPAGRWIVRLLSRSSQPAPFHAWIERYDPAQSAFEMPDPTSTIGSISCGRETVVVGSYDAHKAGTPISFFSSRGPTRDGRQKPEISAPGHAVLAARSRSGIGVVRKSGTSMAAPAVTGLVALIYAEARRRNLALTAAQLRDVLIRSARRDPPAGVAGGWDDRYGYGRASGGALGLLP